MKKSLFMIAVTSLMFSNCSHVDYIGTVGNEQEVTATMENEPQQRSSVNDNGYFTWSTGRKFLCVVWIYLERFDFYSSLFMGCR